MKVLAPAMVWSLVRSTKFLVLEPVPPFATATTPMTLAALPLMLPLTAVPGIVVEADMAPVPLP